MIGHIGRLGLTVPLDKLKARVGGEEKLRKICNAMTVRERVHPGRPRNMSGAVRKAYMIDNGLFIMPRIKADVLLKSNVLTGVGTDPANAPLPPPRRIPACDPVEPLYEYQEAAIAHVLERLAENRGVTYLQMDTGLGKSRVGCGIIVARGEPALVVVPTDAIAGQWIDEFAETYPGISVAIYRNQLKGDKAVTPATHDVLIVIINTFRDKGPEFMEGIGTVVLDEAHEYHSVCNLRALWLSQTNAVVGLSATPEERPDGLDRYIFHHLGTPVYPKDIPGFDVNAVNFECEVRIVEYDGHPESCDTAVTPSGMVSAIMTIGNILKDKCRLALVAAEVERLYWMDIGMRDDAVPKRHGVFVFAETREYLPTLRDALLSKFSECDILTPELDDVAPGVSLLRGGVAKTAVGDARKAGSHIVLTTYGFSRRGISLPDMTSIVIATPRRNGIRQIIGRILRRNSDESIVRQIVDIVDVNTGLKSQISDRVKVYKERKYPISKVKACWKMYECEGAEALAPAPAEAASLSELSTDEILDMYYSMM